MKASVGRIVHYHKPAWSDQPLAAVITYVQPQAGDGSQVVDLHLFSKDYTYLPSPMGWKSEIGYVLENTTGAPVENTWSWPPVVTE